ncbi:chromosome segregation protein SMC [Aciduliprofundum boonei T469]|uniref:Chromosome partition protein Smc n=2 Tax=Candidatus Aciduliprofundum boonei TaxID=379547 RepID=D3TAQ9_ACIB4|nr:chromosome segregation protein SMC [Aciduliprofundum boonei T469]
MPEGDGMYLKAIELENFKSFGRKTRLEFKEGFTAISGPNGSGKSNITDAILFVLGPKSSKKIRAQRLTDLIYNGGKNGRPADYCRVSLIFDNRDRVLPLDEDEVKLTRYIKRANNELGYNSYFYINDEQARLQDFNSILIHAKIEADGYNFVQQGDVTRIVEMTPVERRTILDDIAGITKFDNEIKKAEDKKKITEENMGRIEARLDEIKRNMEKLEKDRMDALKYKELEEELKEIKAKIAYLNMKKAENSIESYNSQLRELQSAIDSLREEIEKRRSEEEEIKKKIEEVDAKIRSMGSGEIVEMKNKIEELKIKYAEEKMKKENKEDRIQEYKERIKDWNEQLSQIRQELKDKEEELRSLKERRDAIRKEYEDRAKELENKERNLGSANEKFRELQRRALEIQEELKKLRNEYATKVEEENKVLGNISRIKGDIAAKEESMKDIEAAIKDAEWRISQFKNENKDVEKKKKALESRYYELRNEETKLSKELKKKDNEVKELSIEYEKIKARMESSQDALSRAVMAVLAARDRGELRGIYGTISELGNVDDKYALAIEVAAGNRMMSIVCEDDESAAKAIEFLKRHKLGRAIFLPLNKMLRGRPRGKAILASRDPHAIGFAMDLIKFDPKFEAAFWYVFGDTVIVDTLDNARKLMGGVRLVTLDGQLIEASGAMVGGSVERKKKVSMGNLDEIGRKLREAREERENIEMRLNAIRDELDRLIEEIRNIKTQDNSAQLSVWLEEKKKNQEKLKDIKKQIEELEKEKRNYEELRESVRNEIEKIKSKIEDMEKEDANLRNRMNNLIPEKLSNEIKELRNMVDSLRSNLQNVEKDIVKVEGEINGLKEKEDEITKNIENAKEEIKNMEKDIENSEKVMEDIHLERRKLEEVVRKEEEKIKDLVDERDKLVKNKERIVKEISKKEGDIKVKDSLKIHIIAKLNEEQGKYEEAKREYESYGIDVKNVESISSLKNRLNDVQAQMMSMGPVNMRSIEEYDEEKERYDKLKEEYKNLEKEKKNLLELVRELNGKKKDGLMKVYNAINENFKKIYKEISNGGEAEILLENPENPFKGGLIIKVKPVGKKFVRLESLSGGEKSLTALAFIFAIQQYDPSPFYVLDEVDMFLDGMNAEMVGRIIKRNSRTAQFIVISLRKATLKFADYVIGVTQQGDGLSRVFSQNIPGVSEGAA